jgi:hypothetical protein
MLPRGVNVTEAALQRVGIEQRAAGRSLEATVVTRCATSVMYTAAARASACIGRGGTRPARASVQTLESAALSRRVTASRPLQIVSFHDCNISDLCIRTPKAVSRLYP